MESETGAENLKQCSNCKVWRQLDQFVGKSGTEVKRCQKCRNKDAKQKKKPEVMARNNARGREKKYYQDYRNKKREENEEEYLRHNAEVAKNWRENNKEHLSEWRKKNFATRIKAIRQQAQVKNIVWSDTMTDEVCLEMMTSPCFYCGFKEADDALNGIDRIDSTSHYVIGNTVPCCKYCNFAKTSLDGNTYIKRCGHISCYHGGPGCLNDKVWLYTVSKTTYNNYKTRAESKGLEFALTEDVFEELRSKDCHYCGMSNTDNHYNGVDRNNNTLGYNLENCVACCRECNYMKKGLTAEEFIGLCKRVALFREGHGDIPDIPEQLCTILKRKTQE